MVKHALNHARHVPQLSAATIVVAAAIVGAPILVASTLLTHGAVAAVAPSCTLADPESKVTITASGAEAAPACQALVKEDPSLRPAKPAGDVVCDFNRKGVRFVVRTVGWDLTYGQLTCWALGAPQPGRS